MKRIQGLIALAALASLISACAGDPTVNEERRYKLTGKVVAIKTTGAHHLRVDGEEVAGLPGTGRGGGPPAPFMQKMTMDWRVKPEISLADFKPGDEVTADVVAPGDGTAYLENIVVTKKAEQAAEMLKPEDAAAAATAKK